MAGRIWCRLRSRACRAGCIIILFLIKCSWNVVGPSSQIINGLTSRILLKPKAGAMFLILNIL